MDCQMPRHNLPLFKGLLLCMSLVCFVGQRFNSEAKSVRHDQQMNAIKEQELEIDVDVLRNASCCKYYVEPFELGEHHGLLPKTLYHIKCIPKTGNRSEPCLEKEGKTYMCIQTYKEIEIHNRFKREKIFTGCVCAIPVVNSIDQLDTI